MDTQQPYATRHSHIGFAAVLPCCFSFLRSNCAAHVPKSVLFAGLDCDCTQVPEVTVSILPAASMSQQRVVLQVTAVRPHVTAVQGSTFSWLGYPCDTTPSSRDFLPGLTAQQEQQQQQEGDEGGTEEDGGPTAAAAADGEGDEGSAESEGSGVTIGSGQSRQQGGGPPIGRESSTSSSSSSSSSSSAISGWKQQVRLGGVLHCICTPTIHSVQGAWDH
jgi:hypothetical protein